MNNSVMKRFILALALFLSSTSAFSQNITIGDDGIVRCKDVPVGTTATIFGDVYEVVDRNLLIQRRDEGKDLSKVCVSNVTDMSQMFMGSVNSIYSFNQSIGNWDVSSVTNMSGIFSFSTFNKPISNWDVSSVTDMGGMFNNSQFNQPIGDWDVSLVTNMANMFSNSPFNQSITNWNVSSVVNMRGMFGGSISSQVNRTPFNQRIGDWDVSSVTDMSFMFASSTFNQPLNNWDVRSVTNMRGMFSNSQFNQPIGDWNVSSVTNMGNMFYAITGYTPFNQPIGEWDVSSVTDMNRMFIRSQFNQPIVNWNVSSVLDMSYMFTYSRFNQPIGSWDISHTPIIEGMFYQSNFNQPINTWCVTNINSEPSDFSTNSPLTPENKPIWGTCPGTPDKVIQASPQNNSSDIARNVVIQWRSSLESAKYQLQVFEGFDPTIIDILVSDTTYTPSQPLKQNFVYNWRVRGFNETLNRYGEWSSVWKFTTEIDPNADQEISLSLNERWNIVGLPVQVDHSNYQELFPNSVISTLFGYTNTYQNKDILEPGKGYWIRMQEAGSATLRGAPIESLELNLQAGWNLVAGPSSSLATSSIDDSNEIIVAGTLFGFNGSYVTATSIDPGKGYWIRANQAGTITLRGGSSSKTSPSHPSMALGEFDRIEFLSNDGDEPITTLYLNGSILSPFSTINFELPPVPPTGNVDVRWEKGMYVTESSVATALIQQGASPLRIRIPEMTSGDASALILIREYVGDQLISEGQISRGEVYSLSKHTNRLEFEVMEKAELPTEFTLDQNYPNPFNPTTTIRFGLPESADVTLEVYTVLGQRVMTLVNENRSAGWHTVSFNGAGLSSGVYVYRIQAGGMVQTKKLMLVK
jgi:surface protein